MEKLTLKDLSLKGKQVLMRVDFNVPMSKEGTINDDSRIRASLPSILYILKQGASLVLMSHLGRPKGTPDPKLSLKPIAKRLSELLNQPVAFSSDSIGLETEQKASHLKSGEVLLLENLRFHPGEEEPEKEPEFVDSLAKLGDSYVNDAFGTAHRAHASTTLIAKKFPKKAAMGFLMEKEIQHLSLLLDQPEKPFYTLIGGAKISTKTGVIYNLLKKVDLLFIGGAMAYTFLKAEGIEVGDSLWEESELKTAQDLLSEYPSIHLPLDLVIADRFSKEAQTKIISSKEGIPKGWQGMDIGPRTVEKWSAQLSQAATIFWNGPLGVFEMEPFAKGTNEIAKKLAHSKGKVIIGGGDSLAAIEKLHLTSQFAHVSTGGGASLEFLEYGHLPGIDALSSKK